MSDDKVSERDMEIAMGAFWDHGLNHHGRLKWLHRRGLQNALSLKQWNEIPALARKRLCEEED